MAIFKILKGASSRIDTDITPFKEGYAYFTPDDGGFYIDAVVDDSDKRIRINQPINEQSPTYGTEENLSELNSGEKISVSFGKIAKAISDLISHIGNKKNPHGVTAEDIGALTSLSVTDSTTKKNYIISMDNGFVFLDDGEDEENE